VGRRCRRAHGRTLSTRPVYSQPISTLKFGPRSARPRWLGMEQSTATFSLPTDVCWEPVPHYVKISKLPVWPLTRTPAFKAARRSLAGAVRQTLSQWEADGRVLTPKAF